VCENPRVSDLKPEDLAAAERLAALELTPEEREQALLGMPLYLAMIARRRAVELANGLGPATGFDPRLPGQRVDATPRPLVRSARDPGPLPASDAEIAFAPVWRLSRWIASGALTSRRLTGIYLARLREVGPALHCAVTITDELAHVQAERADAEIARGEHRGPLHGIPWGAKDLLDTAGVPTTWGAPPFRDRTPARDAEVVARLERAGAVLVAKLSLGELAQGDVWFGGRTRNPWQPEAGSGGSSAGSAAATAAGCVGFALGSETLGSITNPCMICGTVGLRPTFGIVPRSGAMALCWSLDKIGPICRSVEDTALVLDAIRGAHEEDPDSIDAAFGFDATASVDGLRVGFLPSSFRDAHASQRPALDVLLDAGIELVEVAIPELPYETLITILNVEAAAAFDELTRDGRDDELVQQEPDSWPNQLRTARFVPAVEFVQMQRVRRRVMHAMRELFDEVHCVAAPDMGGPLLMPTNASGHPSLTLRSGFDEEGMPKSLTLHGRLFDEATLCRIGLELESRLGVQHRHP
jgi:Asp-tRNA(Asn)/Glu-tRNA(Gln) amidotransferase A subunit family amidase